MNVWLLGIVLVLSLAAAVWTVVMIVRDQSPPGDAYFGLLGALMLVLAVQVVTGLVSLGVSDRVVEKVTFAAYDVTALLVLPVGAALALVERSRWGTTVLLVALLTVAAMELRLWALWNPHA
ncbi:hypothetical protein [Nocardioides acrostichi]|uniref:Uncharacterized protein n=1 Tax=Nocardioides acrostichi TaxID=2784339 RepID=A0A930V198_9ACTN|nr:hypothetical protein [Nocardioides acrostichi]MBF4162031.1 hypothetical protein [Nocardioides acrostichi]